ncbi:MAG: heavy-metal-associated domain-containing protein [Desulfobacterales bacterium]|nr:heavy-metal-associated domain-containing protein [Desulfobacterales bacterium]
MTQQSFNIPKISCGHCVMAIKDELSEMPGVHSVEGNPESRTVVVDWDAPASEDAIRAKLQEINYPAD